MTASAESAVCTYPTSWVILTINKYRLTFQVMSQKISATIKASITLGDALASRSILGTGSVLPTAVVFLRPIYNQYPPHLAASWSEKASYLY